MSEEKRDWKKIVADSKGSMVFIPGKLTDTFRDLNVKRQRFIDKLEGIAKEEIELQVLTNNAMLEARKLLAADGIKIWRKDVGLNPTAQEDGELVLNLADPR